MYEYRLAQRRFARFWTECQNCAGSAVSEINCGANDCPQFFAREKARMDLDEQSKNILRMTNYYNKRYKEGKL
jgi:DNA polymerase delta subunit 1